MKTNKLKKHAMIFSACLLLICAVVGISIIGQGTDEIKVTASIAEKNVDYRAMARLAFTVKLNEDAPDGTVGIAMWKTGTTSYSLENAIYTSYDKLTDADGKEYYHGIAIPLAEMKNEYMVAVVIKTATGVIISSEPESCSVAAYANERLSDLEATLAAEGALSEKQVSQKNLYEKLLALVGVPSEFFEEIQVYVSQEASVLPLKGGAGGAIAIVTDDGDIPTMTMLDDMFVRHGLVGDVALILNKVYNKADGTINEEALAQFREFTDNGRWSIVNHSGTHTWWGEMNGTAPYLDANGNTVDNQEKLNYEVVTSQQKLRELFPGQRVLTYAYPGFSAVESQLGDVNDSAMLRKYIYSQAARELIMKHHISARNSRGDGNLKATDTDADWDWIKGWFLTPERITKWLEGELNAAAATGGVIIASIHALTTDPDQPAKDGGYSLLNTYMETFCEKVAERVNSGELWNAHYEDIILYVRETQNASVKAILDEGNEKITVTVSDTLDDSIYNHELTVRVKVPENWKAVKISYNGKTTYANAKNVDGKSMVDFDIIPDNGSAVITPEIKDEDSTLASDFGVTLANGTKIDTNYFPGFVRKAVTFSMDDGIVTNDSPFINIVKRGGILGTFNLINTDSKYGLTDEQYKALYEGYEVANHHLFHPLPWFGFDGFDAEDFADVPIHETVLYSDSIKNTLDSQYIYKTETEGLYYIDYNYHFAKNYNTKYWHPIMTDEAYAKYAEETKKDIENLFGEGSVVGFAYPHGKTNDAVKAYFENAGYLYARRTLGKADNVNFSMPADRYDWSYNANHTTLNSVMSDFAACEDNGNLKFFCFGVHAVDYKNAGWDELEEFVDTYGNRSDEFYYATVRDIFEYEDAVKALEITEEKIVNGSDIDVFVTVNNVKIIIPANSTYTLK